MTFTPDLESLDAATLRIRFLSGQDWMSCREVFAALAADRSFRDLFAETLRNAAFEAFFFETPAISEARLADPFECVLVEGPALSRLVANPTAFREHFASPGPDVVTFRNPGGDASLVVPAPLAGYSCYAHLAVFLRKAPARQVDDFWRTAGEQVPAAAARGTYWLSTAGMGVPWLHLRMDSRPKYYRHAPYKAGP